MNVPHRDYPDVPEFNSGTSGGAAAGDSATGVASQLDADGYRTTGNKGRNLFTKDTVCDILQNRFYLGELPDGNGRWLKGKHDAFIDLELFDAAQEARMFCWCKS
ncbi:MAG: recombinase family protein [Chloroflexi bacterium]|nr:recombinase family protein [Chloroflexota bacterium]